MPWEDRAAIFLKAAELLAGRYRMTLNAATMLGQSKTAFQAEIDAACELIDFLRFNAYYAQQIMTEQPEVVARHVELRSSTAPWRASSSPSRPSTSPPSPATCPPRRP